MLALIVYGVVHALNAGAAEKPKAAATVAVDRGAVSTQVGTAGTVEPAQTRSLSFTVDGTVQSVSVRAGSTVQAGQDLAKVDDTDAAKTVSDAQSALDDAEQQLTDARNSEAKQTAAAKSGTTSTGCVAAAAYTYPTVTATTTTSPTPSASATSHPTTAPARTRRLVTVLDTVKERLRVWAGSTVPAVPTCVETAPRSTATVTAAFGFSDAPAVTASTSR